MFYVWLNSQRFSGMSVSIKQGDGFTKGTYGIANNGPKQQSTN